MRLPDADDPDRGDARPLAQKLGWMAAIWLMSVGFIGVVAYAIRWWIHG
ncbi:MULTISPECIES: DUF2474 family protein [Blastomonas]|jgi:hypothetical protein|nr:MULTISPECIES: DUF2474 family protein [Blastomonas]AOG02358.1 hypothetical protein BSY18_479 [Blastomonas sp. RAC04]MDK2755741.1 DUF2474 domain-containing protein [Blastomonas fulva]MDM7930152.1 DUF2474 family protein [Blastomonas fulva]MDM7965968.1 DUF2474 family protein [Blastomonas fulva]